MCKLKPFGICINGGSHPMKERYKTIRIIDSHTEGEPTRLVYEGFPDLGSGSMKERLALLKSNHDEWRRSVILEPRGNDILVGALLCEPQNKEHTCGVIFFNNTGYLGMCGHGTIGLIASLFYLGKIDVGQHIIETPVGNVMCYLHEDGSVSVQNVPSYRYKKDVHVTVDELGQIKGDIAWGGNWFFLVSEHQERIDITNVDRLTNVSTAIMQALKSSAVTGEDGADIDHIELFSNTDLADSKSFVMCPGGAYDRSPCGTGTSAKLACLAADGLLAESTIWHQASVIGSVFQGFYQKTEMDGQIIPTIRGRAYICSENKLLIDEQDPFRWGFSSKESA